MEAMEAILLACTDMLRILQESTVLGALRHIALFYCLGIVLKATVSTPFKVYLLSRILPGVNFKKLGRWAVVTGATDGIGKEYANVLAKRGLDIVLVSRSPDKLSRVANEIKTEHGVQVKTIAVDFTHTDIYSKIEKELEGLDIAILINNVGIGSPTCPFLKTENLLNLTANTVNVNCVSMTIMSALVLPRMIEKGRGVVVNISSIAATGYIGSTVYSGSKAYASKFSECLRRTYANSGVIIQTVEPGMVETPMLASGVEGERVPNFLTMARMLSAVSVGAFVKSAVNTIGWADHCYGHVLHHFMYMINQVQPQFMQDSILLKDMEEASKQ